MYPQLQSYQNSLATRIQNSKPEQLMAMLYEGMITRIKQSKEWYTQHEAWKARESIFKAMRIADALMDHVNLETGGEAAKNLERLLLFIINELAAANKFDTTSAHLDNALRVIAPLHECWATMAERAVTDAHTTTGAE